MNIIQLQNEKTSDVIEQDEQSNSSLAYIQNDPFGQQSPSMNYQRSKAISLMELSLESSGCYKQISVKLEPE